MIFSLPALPFEISRLDRALSPETIEFHYGKHHQAYVDKTNELIKGTRYAEMTLEEIVSEAEDGIYDNASQAWNHTFYWNCITNVANATPPEGDLLEALIRDFGSFDQFKSKFLEAGKTIFGSGWVWLVKDPNGKLEILKMSNADSPVGHDSIPILTCDVWEHAYYIDFRNERAKYLEAFFRIINWEFAARNFSLDTVPDMTSLMTGSQGSRYQSAS